MNIHKLILSSVESSKRTIQKQGPMTIDLPRYRHSPNVAPFKLGLSQRTFKDSDAFIKECKKDTEYAQKANYRYKKDK